MNAQPSLEFDAMRATDLFGGPFTPPGFYYKTFIRPRRLWPLYEKVLRHAAGLGRLREGPGRARVAHRVPAPPRGRARGGRRRGRPERRDRGRRAGRRRGARRRGPRARRPAARRGLPRARARARRRGPATLGVELLSAAPALGAFDGLVPIWQRDTLHQVRAQRIVYATGSIEQPLLFPGNDLPGVMLSGGAVRLAALYGLSPGSRAVVATVDDRGLEAAVALLDRGVEVAAVADLREHGNSDSMKQLMRHGVADPPRRDGAAGGGPLAAPARHARAARRGRGRRRRAHADLRPAGRLRGQRPGHVAARPVGRADRLRRAAGLLHARRAARGPARRGRGGGRGRRSARPSAPAPWPAPMRRTRSASATTPRARACARRRKDVGQARARPTSPCRRPVTSSRRGKCFACLCEDVTAKDIHLSVEEGYDSIELSKRYTTTTMGPCQGRMCQLPGRAADGPGDRPEPCRRGHHHRAAALARGADGRARRPPVRARQALVDARPPPRARARTCSGRATGGAPTTTATRARRRWPCTRPRA